LDQDVPEGNGLKRQVIERMKKYNRYNLIGLGLAGLLAFSAVGLPGYDRIYADPVADADRSNGEDPEDGDPVDQQNSEDGGYSDLGSFESMIAGAGITLNRYLASDFSYDSSELFERIHVRATMPIPTETQSIETQPAETEPETEEMPPVTEAPVATDPVIETLPETLPQPTEAPHVGYTGMAVSLPKDNYVNVRTAPTSASKKVGKIYANAVADVIEEVAGADGAWFLIQSGTVTGYVKAEFFAIGEQALAMKESIATRIGTVNTYNLRLRSTPDLSTKSNIITNLAFGTTTVIVGEEGDFYKIELDVGYFGYIHRDYVNVEYQFAHAISLDEERIAAEQAYQEQLAREAEEAARKAEEESRLAEEARKAEEDRKAEEARLAEESRKAAEAARKAAEAKQAEEDRKTLVQLSATYVGPQKYVGEAVQGNEIDITFYFRDGHTEKNLPGWRCDQALVPLPEGTNTFTLSYGDVSTQFPVNVIARPAETNPPETQAPPETQPAGNETDDLRQQICNYALQFVGNPYCLGGTDLLHGTDCSGFVMNVFAHFGIKTTRTSRSQAGAGTPIPVDLNTLRPGDLLFYDTDGKISHVALYIGNGQIVHAANPQFGICIWEAFYRTPCKAVTFLP